MDLEDIGTIGAVVVALLILAAAGLAYMSADEQRVPITGREQRVAMSEQEQAEIGRDAFRQVLVEHQGPIRSGDDAAMVRRVGERIARVSDEPGLEWEFALLDSPLANAFCLPGGKVAVYSGMLRIAQNEAGLAAVMAHEIAHAIAQHGAERALQHQLAEAAGAAVAVGVGNMDPQQRGAVLALFGAGAQYGVLLPFSREQESEADRIGLIYMARAGYDPREARQFWQRMAAAEGGQQPPEYASTHPSTERRIADLERWLPEALAEYEEARSARERGPWRAAAEIERTEHASLLARR